MYQTGLLQLLSEQEQIVSFLGIRRFTPWYYIWQVFGVGESPSMLDRDVVANDIERIKLYYENLGFFDAEVDTSIIEFRKNRYEVSFLIREGPQSSIRSVAYTGLPDFEEENLLRNFYRNSVFSGRMLNDSTFSYNNEYRAQELREEQTRIINFLKKIRAMHRLCATLFRLFLEEMKMIQPHSMYCLPYARGIFTLLAM